MLTSNHRKVLTSAASVIGKFGAVWRCWSTMLGQTDKKKLGSALSPWATMFAIIDISAFWIVLSNLGSSSFFYMRREGLAHNLIKSYTLNLVLWMCE